MTAFSGFTDNPLISRHDHLLAARSLVRPLENHRSLLGARVKVRPASSAGFDDIAAQLEGFSRPLLAISAILDDPETLVQWCKGLEHGVDPEGPEYWGDLGDFDQRMVEMESISLALLSAPDAIFSRLSEKGNKHLRKWLQQINRHSMPENNWRWFRIFVNLALTKLFNVPRHDVEKIVEHDLTLLDSYYLEGGWSSDGSWGEDRRQADYYSGSFAMQFSQLLYVRFADGDQDRKEKYTRQAMEFAAKYWRYFDVDGAAIPFGRSMTYRFAFAAFWAAAAVAGVQLPTPVDKLGTVKGLLLRHLRWWKQHEDIFNSDGVMNIGFAYPNMYLSENYNSPQSVYWCLKAFLVLILPETHEFWTCKELPHPIAQTQGLPKLDFHRTIWPPRHIIDNSPEHHYLLSSGQMTTKPHKAKEAKYCKFAYSSAFGFSVPAGSTTLGQLAPDSTLCASIDGGETWRVRNSPDDVRLEPVPVGGEGQRVNGLTSVWKPWKMLDLRIETTLVPLLEYFPGWHLRIHRIRWSKGAEAAFLTDRIQFVDGGFAIPALTATGMHIPEISWDKLMTREGYCSDGIDALVMARAGAGGISQLSLNLANTGDSGVNSETFVLGADPNTNLISPRTFIPCVRHEIKSEGPEVTEREVWLVSGVFAVSTVRIARADVVNLWERKPTINYQGLHDGDIAGMRFKVDMA